MVAWISMRFKDNAPAGAEIKTYFYRSRGPGGQRKNRRETAVKIVHISTGIAVRATEHRTQSQNRELALERLEEKLANLRRVKKKRIPTRKPRSVRDAEIRKKRCAGKRKRQDAGLPMTMITEAVTLRQFLSGVKDVLSASFPLHYRITAEIARLNLNQSSGHCYFTLVEKDGETVVANVGAVIWKSRVADILSRFRQATGHELKDGMKVMVVAEVVYHENYGFKLGIADIDPSYTLGEFALHRKKILAQLEKEGLLARNKQLPFPEVPQRIAVISSPTAAGYEDFVNTLENNPYGYRIADILFPSCMQGEQAEESILASMQKCLARIREFDVLVIIRGGGDQVDLHCFDSYNIGKAIALFPVPVLTGIGHKRDETVTEIVAHKGLISPTAVGEFVVGRMREFEERLDESGKRIVYTVENAIAVKQNAVKEAMRRMALVTDFFLEQNSNLLNGVIVDFRNNVLKNTAGKEFFLKQMPVRISSAAQAYVKGRLNALGRYKDKTEMMNPLQVLKRGYSITFHNGKVVKNAGDIRGGDRLTTRLYKGTVESSADK